MPAQTRAIQERHTVSATSSTIGGNRDIHTAETTGCASPGGWWPWVEEHDVQIGEQVTAPRDGSSSMRPLLARGAKGVAPCCWPSEKPLPMQHVKEIARSMETRSAGLPAGLSGLCRSSRLTTILFT